jgi:U6 snRNA-associated Sm-like protein LSm8
LFKEMSIAADYLKKRVSLITTDGRHYLGTLESCDQLLNVVLSSCVERMYGEQGGAEDMLLGAYMIRGARVVCVGAVDTIEEASCDLRSVRGVALGKTCTV